MMRLALMAAIALVSTALGAAGCEGGPKSNGSGQTSRGADPPITITQVPSAAAQPSAPAPTAPAPPAPPRRDPEPARLTAPPEEVARAVKLERIARGLARPVAIIDAPGDAPGRLFIVEQGGKIRILRDGKVADKPFADLSKLVSRGHNEQGLLGLAFHPRFVDKLTLYVNYTDRSGDTRVVEYKVESPAADRLDPASARELLMIDQPWGNHNGGHLLFGRDGLLYIGMGDGGAAGDPRDNAQNPDSLLGKMLRLDVDAESPKPEVIQVGLRNPWRYSFDRKTGDLYIGDVGQDRFEWVLAVPAGKLTGHNFGWNVTEGFRCFGAAECDRSRFTPPILDYDHRVGCSITGGHVYRGRAIPELDGVYFYADYCTAILRSLRWVDGRAVDLWDWRPVLDPDSKLSTLSSFGEDDDGELYLVSLDGAIYRLVRAR
jgi:glucose/arabinose dehydrogenase